MRFGAASSPGNTGELEELWAAGVPAFKAFISNPGGEGEGRFREVDDATLYEGMSTIAEFGGLLALHAESDAVTAVLGEAAVRSGRTGARDSPPRGRRSPSWKRSPGRCCTGSERAAGCISCISARPPRSS
ncbi:hypothetical protein HMSSN139_25100 [Paenibacillus sp. HMSSN-139]|nr:hypothetical protein HMSSN139_25100 [Paenibacillus sp. HMSSN-139]